MSTALGMPTCRLTPHSCPPPPAPAPQAQGDYEKRLKEEMDAKCVKEREIERLVGRSRSLTGGEGGDTLPPSRVVASGGASGAACVGQL